MTLRSHPAEAGRSAGIPMVLQRIDNQHVLDCGKSEVCGKRQYCCLFYHPRVTTMEREFPLTIGIMYTKLLDKKHVLRLI